MASPRGLPLAALSFALVAAVARGLSSAGHDRPAALIKAEGLKAFGSRARGNVSADGDVLEAARARATGPEDGPWREWLDMSAFRPPWPQKGMRIDKLKSNDQRIAVLTSGTLKRYFMTQAAEGLVQPMVDEGYSVDYYVALSVAEFDAWNGNANNYKPELSPQEDKFPEVKEMIKQKMEQAGGRVRAVDILKDVQMDSLDAEFVDKGEWNGKDDRGRHARDNVIRMLKPLRAIGEKMEEVEAQDGKYDYVIILKDDTIWLKPFSMTTLLTHRLKDFTPEGYVLKCDAGLSTYSPPDTAYTEYIFVLGRRKATPFYRMHEVLTEGGLAGTRNEVGLEKYWSAMNFEQFAKRLADDHHVKIQRTPPFLIPMQRGGRLEVMGEVKTCLHKCCDSSHYTAAGVPLLNPRAFFPACNGPLEPHLRQTDFEYELF